MIVIGLTGGIAMGKSTVAAQFARLGARICSADAVVHRLLGEGGAGVAPVAALFPQALTGNHIDRARLGRAVFGDKAALAALERVLHPLVAREEMRFAAAAARLGARVTVLDIPLLFETDAHQRVDVTVAVTAPHFLQRQRALLRPHMTPEKLQAVLARQLADAHRRARADYVIPTGLGKAYSFAHVKRIMHDLATRSEATRPVDGRSPRGA